MPSDAKTPLGLSQWIGRDRPKREDFNTDNQKIDLACRSVLTSLSNHLEGDAHPSALSQQRWDVAASHMGEGIATSGGMHGLRYYQGVLEVNVGGLWTPCTVGERNYKVYGICVDTLEPDPEASVTYTDDAVGLTPGSADWDSTFIGALQPCLVKNGSLVCYLQKDNYHLTADGQPADIESGEGGDVMVQVPKMASAIYMEGTKLYVKVTDYPNAPHLDSRFCYNAHTRLVQGDRECFYVGAYLGSLLGGKLRSLSGMVPLVSRSLSDCRDFAHTTGTGYELLSYYPYLLLQCLYLIRYKSRHSQRSVGMGYVTQYFTGKTATGGTDTKGLFYGEATGLEQMKLFGIEDFWGNLSYFLDGVRTDENLTLWTAISDFASREEGVWRNLGQFPDQDQSYIIQVHGNNEAGFLMAAANISASNTYWCDGCFYHGNCIAYTGGDFGTLHSAGAFFTAFRIYEDTINSRTGARLMYL